MGLNERTTRIYLSIGFGKLRKKCSPDDPKAIKRETDKGVSYAIEYNSISGKLEDILFRDDPNYGRSWILQIEDNGEKFQVQIPEESRYASDLLERIPRLHRGDILKFTPYDFEDLKANKRRKGLSIKDSKTDAKIDNYYKTYSEKDGWKYSHGYPVYEGDWKDKDECKMYFIRVLKFLRQEAQQYIAKAFGETAEENIEDENPKDDLPF